jgi:hypothetical protein
MDANQSRRRAGSVDTAKVSNIALPLLGESTLDFQYQPLDSLVDCTRVIEIEPAEDANDIPRCKLIHVTFGEKPKYEALSYMWGDQTLREQIFVDGKRFFVAQNLWYALHYLRKRVIGRRYWIDAICINQADIPERNRQLRIMPHIYMRAHMVLIWLGKKHTRWEDSGTLSNEAIAYSWGFSLPLAKAEQLYCDDYWDRVWIVQEIGKARKIRVCISRGEVPWDVFIQELKEYIDKVKEVRPDRLVRKNNGKAGPLNLEKQLQEKYRRGHTLRELLENYQTSVCKDPRDKIYGFIGLAVDARGFPMDYQKSFWEVWKDTMRFANKHGMISSGSDIIRFGRLVKRLLGDSSVVTKDVVAQESAESAFLAHLPVFDDQDLFNLSGYVAGMVICVGPSPEEILSKLDAEDEWREQIQQNFPTDLGNAYRDNNLLMQVILDSEIDHSVALSSHIPTSAGNPRRHWGRSLQSIKRRGNMLKDRGLGKFPCQRKLNPMVWKILKRWCHLPCGACIRSRDTMVKIHLGKWASRQGKSNTES